MVFKDRFMIFLDKSILSKCGEKMTDVELKTFNKLTLLMKTFEISANDLSAVIHVDVSLVSKWRCGKRSITEKSVYPEAIAKFFISLDKPNHYSKIVNLLSTDFPETISLSSEKELVIYLKKWLLTEPAEIANTYGNVFESVVNSGLAESVSILRFKGDEGRRQAMLLINEYHLSCNERLERIIYTTEDGEWFYDDPGYVDKLRNQNLESISLGHSLTIIHPVNRNYNQLGASIISWIRVHLTGKTVDYYVPDYNNDPLHYTYVLIPNRLVLISASSKNYTKTTNTWITNDEAIVQRIGEILREIAGKSRAVFDRYYIDNSKQYYIVMNDTMNRINNRYYFGPTLQYVPIDEQLLIRVLVDSGVTEEIAQQRVKLYTNLSRANVSVPSRFIIDIKALQENLQQKTVQWNYISILFGERIIVSQDVYRQSVKNLFSFIGDCPEIEAGIWDSDVRTDIGGVNVLAQENISAQFISVRMETPFALVLQETSFVVATLEYLKNIWGQIPSLQKDKTYILEQVTALIDTPFCD